MIHLWHYVSQRYPHSQPILHYILVQQVGHKYKFITYSTWKTICYASHGITSLMLGFRVNRVKSNNGPSGSSTWLLFECNMNLPYKSDSHFYPIFNACHQLISQKYLTNRIRDKFQCWFWGQTCLIYPILGISNFLIIQHIHFKSIQVQFQKILKHRFGEKFNSVDFRAK